MKSGNGVRGERAGSGSGVRGNGPNGCRGVLCRSQGWFQRPPMPLPFPGEQRCSGLPEEQGAIVRPPVAAPSLCGCRAAGGPSVCSSRASVVTMSPPNHAFRVQRPFVWL